MVCGGEQFLVELVVQGHVKFDPADGSSRRGMKLSGRRSQFGNGWRRNRTIGKQQLIRVPTGRLQARLAVVAHCMTGVVAVVTVGVV